MIVIDINKFIDLMVEEIPDLEERLKFMFYWSVENLLVFGHIEQSLIIVDLTDFIGVLDIPAKKLKSFVSNLSYSFKAQMFRLASCNVNDLMHFIFNVALRVVREAKHGAKQSGYVHCRAGEICKFGLD